MSHKSGHVIINRVSESDNLDVVRSASVELSFPPDTSLDAKMKKIRQVERLLDKLDHDED
jgi:transcriptional regulator NrdR family protein